jgi:hypothetical protein
MAGAWGEMGAAARGVPRALREAGDGGATGLLAREGVGIESLLRQFMRRMTGERFGTELPPEARLARRPTHAAMPPEMLAAAATRPSESPLYRMVGTLQKSDDTKVKLMEQMLASLQQKTAARELPLVAGERAPARKALPAAEEAGEEGGSTITVKIVGDEEKVKKMVAEALRKESLYPLGYTE